MWKPVKLGTPDQITSLDTTETMYDIFLIGSFLTLAFYNLVMYRHRKNSASLLLGIMFMAMSVRVAVTGNMLVTRLLADFPWALQLKLEYLSAPLVFLIFIRLIESVYPGYLPRWVTLPLTLLIVADMLVVVAIPVLTYSRIVIVYNTVKSVMLLAITVRFFFAALRGAREAWAMIGAVTIFLLITLGETFHYTEILLSRDFAPLGFLLSLLNVSVSNEIYLHLATTTITLGAIVAIGNVLAVSVSKSLTKVESRLEPIDFSALTTDFGITHRETEILSQVVQGKSNKEIGGTLFISEGTVKNHLYSIMRKLKVSNRTELVLRLRGQPSLTGN
jgi:DNA-binding CsgD family transcriptional regulator